IDIKKKFHFIKELGSGAYGSVLLVKDKESNQKIALKIMPKRKTSENKFLREFSVSSYLSSHPNIIRSFDMVFQTQDHFMFAQEVAPLGDLFFLITPHVGLPEVKVKRCAMQISNALEFISKIGLVHMDVKPENVLVFDQECHCVKITDFGISRVKGTVIRFKVGSTSYMAPEVCELTGEKELAVDSTLDVWGFGVLLYLLITGEFPWKVAMSKDKAFRRFVTWQSNTHCNDPPASWNKLSPCLWRMFRCLLAVDCSERNKSTKIVHYMGERWKTDSTSTAQNPITGLTPNSYARDKESLSNHLQIKESDFTSMSCHFIAQSSAPQFEELPGQCQDNALCPLILMDDQISMFVGAEVEIT
ncbi:serine/threonine-protein kinase SBK1-like, partial [Lithobates pipiens]